MRAKISALALIAACVLGSVAVSHAQDDTRRRLAEELLVLTEVDKNMGKILGMMKQMQLDQLKQIQLPKELSKEDAESIASMQAAVLDIMAKDMGWEALKEGFIGLYAEVFSEEELEGITAFYKTPVGASFIRKQPELMQKSMELSQRQMAVTLPKLQKAMQEMKDSVKKSEGEPQE